MDDIHDEEDKEDQGQISQENSSLDTIKKGLRSIFMSERQNNNIHHSEQIPQHSNSFYEGMGAQIGDEENIFSYQSIGMNDPENIRYKKKWVFNQLQKMQFNDNNIIFCIERIENIEQLSKTEILQIAANNIPDEMEIFEMGEDTVEFQNIVNRAKSIYEFGKNKFSKWQKSSFDHQYNHSQEVFPSDNLVFNRRIRDSSTKQRRALSSSSQYYNSGNNFKQKHNINQDLIKSSLILSSNNTQQFFECAICCEQYEIFSQKRLLSCNHQFCSECLKQYILNKINCCQVIQINCPQEGCKEEYNEQQIGDIIQDEYQMERYIKFKQRQQLQLDPDIRWCIRPSCNNTIKGQKNNPKLVCDQCQMIICYFCTNEWHEGYSCEEAIDEDYKKMAKNFKVKYCPQCKSKIQKNDGCNHMTCPRCTYEFCWLCTKKYRAGHFSSSNVRGCPGLMFSNRIPPCFRFWVILKMSLIVLGYFFLIVFAIALAPLALALISIAFPTILYFTIKKEYYYSNNLFIEILKTILLICIGICTSPLNLVMAIFPGIVIAISVCING